MRTIKLCALPTKHSPAQHQTTLLEAIRRSAVEIERAGRVLSPLLGPLPLPLHAGNGKTALA